MNIKNVVALTVVTLITFSSDVKADWSFASLVQDAAITIEDVKSSANDLLLEAAEEVVSATDDAKFTANGVLTFYTDYYKGKISDISKAADDMIAEAYLAKHTLLEHGTLDPTVKSFMEEVVYMKSKFLAWFNDDFENNCKWTSQYFEQYEPHACHVF